MERYVQDIRLRQWCEIIKAANQSGLPRHQWLSEDGIGKDAFYYWQRKVGKYYAEQNGLLSADVDLNEVTGKSTKRAALSGKLNAARFLVGWPR